MRESAIERKVSEYAKSLGWLTYKFVSPSRSGVPDRLYVRQGRVLFIEFKAPGGRLSRLQEIQIGKLKNEGISTYIIDSYDSGKAIFDQEQPS